MAKKVRETPRARNAAPPQRLLALEPAFLHQHKFGSPGAAKAASVLKTNAFSSRLPKSHHRAPNIRTPNAAPTQRLLTLKPPFLHQHRFGSPGAAKAASVLRTNAFLVSYRNHTKGSQTPRAPNAAPAQRLLALEPTFLHQHKLALELQKQRPS